MKDWHIILIAVVLVILLMRRQGANAEEWVWTDYRGRQRTITVHREVH